MPFGFVVVGVQQDRQGCGGGEGSGDALDEAGRDQHGGAGGEPAHDAGQDEHGQRGQQQPLAVEQVGQSAAQEQEPAVSQDVGGHDPLERLRRHAERVLDLGQRGTHRRHVEGVDELHAAQHGEQQGGLPGGSCGRGVWP
nr:hypothetical protein [Microbispora sp. GKU 823]